MSRAAFDKKLEALRALRSEPDSPVTLHQIRKALRDRGNYLVSKAASLAAELNLSALIPDLLAAFDRFLLDPVKSDPQCWAKNAIAKALKHLGHHDAQVYLRGIVHIQLEPVWGGRADSAATLRGTCALALVDSDLGDLEILGHLTSGLADPEKPVRIDTATAIAQLARPEGALLLRLKVLLGDPEPEVMGQCFLSLLSLAPQDSIPLVGQFLKASHEGICLEAAGALAQSRELEALEILIGFWRDRLSPQLRSAVVASLAASPLPESAEFLVTIIEQESAALAARAIEALAASRFCAGMRDRVASVVEGKQDANLARTFEQAFLEKG